MSEAERAFYEWWHNSTMTGDFMPRLREVFLAGWNAAESTHDFRAVIDGKAAD